MEKQPTHRSIKATERFPLSSWQDSQWTAEKAAYPVTYSLGRPVGKTEQHTTLVSGKDFSPYLQIHELTLPIFKSFFDLLILLHLYL